MKVNVVRIWRGDDEDYIVETGKQGKLRVGRLVNVVNKTVGPEEPMDTICRFMHGIDFKPFDGDAAAVLKVVKDAPEERVAKLNSRGEPNR